MLSKYYILFKHIFYKMSKK